MLGLGVGVMKEHGIPMSEPMVRAYLEGKKTMTRRVIVPQPEKGGWNATAWRWKDIYQTWEGEGDFFKRLVEHCPYGQLGDMLWFKETWAVTDFSYGESALRRILESGNVYELQIAYKAGVRDKHPDGMGHDLEWKQCPKEAFEKYQGKHYWRSGRFMPRWTARIVVPLISLRVERLQEITEEDAKAEGIKLLIGTIAESGGMQRPINYRDCFAGLWDSLNAKRGYGCNPWVWVIEFPRHEGDMK